MRKYMVTPNGPRVTDLMHEKDMKQSTLAQEARHSLRTIQNIVSGRPCRPKTLFDVARALGVKRADIRLDGGSLSQDNGRMQPVFGEDKSARSTDVSELALAGDRSAAPEHSAVAVVPNESELYPDSQTGLLQIARAMPEVDDVVFVGYVARIYAESLRALTSAWRIRHLRLLLRDPDAIDPRLPGEIPRDRRAINRRRHEVADTIRDLGSKGLYLIEEPLEVRYYRSQPCLCGLLVRPSGQSAYSAGFLSICRERTPKEAPVDYSPMLSPILRLSLHNAYESALLESFAAWFSFVWAHGSYVKTTSPTRSNSRRSKP